MSQPIHKNQVYSVTVIEQADKGDGVAMMGQRRIFIPGGLVGDHLAVKILRLEKTHAYGKIVEILTPAKHRTEAPCSVFGKCGGCQLQHQNYDSQLRFKEVALAEALSSHLSEKYPAIAKVVPASQPYHYRNKAQFAIGQDAFGFKIGLYRRNSNEIVDVPYCAIQSPEINQVLGVVRTLLRTWAGRITAWDPKSSGGCLRYLFVRHARGTGELMVCLVVGTENPSTEFEQEFISAVKKVTGVKAVLLNQNVSADSVILGKGTRCLWGAESIQERVGEDLFSISLASFLQSNPEQTETLYNIVRAAAALKKTDTVLDLYCGIGTIGLSLARFAKEVVGIEENTAAIRNATEAAEILGISNTRFYEGKVEVVLSQQTILADIVVLDPPRKGCDPQALAAIVAARPSRIVYVSCQPQSLARDITFLQQNHYAISAIQPVDMFPQTVHIETVVTLEKAK